MDISEPRSPFLVGTFVGTFVGRPADLRSDQRITTHGLKVYEKALNLGAGAEAFSASWGRRHAIVDHFRRASESVVVNIAEGLEYLSRWVAMLGKF